MWMIRAMIAWHHRLGHCLMGMLSGHMCLDFSQGFFRPTMIACTCGKVFWERK